MNPAPFVTGAPYLDTFVRAARSVATGGYTIGGMGSYVNLLLPDVVDSALHLNNVMILGASPSVMGFAATTDTDFWYKVVTCPGTALACARTSPTTTDGCSPSPTAIYDQTGRYYYNWAAPGLSFSGNFLDDDLNGAALPVSWNNANIQTNGSLGALLLHHHNGQGKRAEVVLIDSVINSTNLGDRADLGVTGSVSNPTPAMGSNVTLTFAVTNNGPNAATGVKLMGQGGDGLNYVSDDGGGAFNPANGTWTVGTLASGASAGPLHVVVQSTRRSRPPSPSGSSRARRSTPTRATTRCASSSTPPTPPTSR